MRVAIYSRKSVETDTGESIKNQIKFCKEYFERHENCTFEIFEDEGFSGGNTNRPSFQRMMELVKIKQFDIVAVYKIDRIARNIVDFVNIFDELDKLGIKLVSITEGFDPSTPAGKMMMLLLASFAEMERMNIAQRVKDNMKELAKMGRWSGGTPPTGYTTKKVIENGKKVTYLELIEEEAAYINEMFVKYSEGYTMYSINKEFKKRGLNYPTKTIQNLLNNPTYLISTPESVRYLEKQGYTVYGEPNLNGFLPYNRRPKAKGKKSWNDKSKFVGISKHTAIIDLDLWIKVQEMLEKKHIDPHPRESNYTWLTGLIKCTCGRSMSVNSGKPKKDGTRVLYFRCMPYPGEQTCGSKFLRVDVAEKLVMDFLKKLSDINFLQEYINDKKDTTAIESSIQVIKKKIVANDKAINNLVDKLMLLSNDASIAITKKIEELSSANNNLKEELLKLEREKLFQQKDKDNLIVLHTQIVNFVTLDMDLETRRRTIKTILEYLIWDSEKKELRGKIIE